MEIKDIVNTVICGDCLDVMKQLPDEVINCVVTSPPYWGLRNYGVDGQIGLEKTPEEYIAKMVELFREVRRALRKDGTCFLNLGDSYAANRGYQVPDSKHIDVGNSKGMKAADFNLKPKDLCLIPSRVAKALQEPYYIGKIKSEKDRIWLAAIIEGEGSIYIQKQCVGVQSGKSNRTQDSYCVGIAITNTEDSLVLKAASICGKNNIQEHEAKEKRRNHYTWRITGNIAKDILREVYPYLVCKQRQSRIAIGCPPSGDVAEKCWLSLKDLHKGRLTEIDMPEPNNADLWEPGWYLRSMIPWVKRNPMPESTTDRPTTAIEYVFLMTKSAKYWYDAEVIKKTTETQRPERVFGAKKQEGTLRQDIGNTFTDNGKRNRRNSDWFFDSWQGLYSEDDEPLALVVNPMGSKEAHFATFPKKLVEPCILAGCPKEVCPKCGKARERIVERKAGRHTPEEAKKRIHATGGAISGGTECCTLGATDEVETKTIGFTDCNCGVGFLPGVVLDPFMGSGTVGYVAACNQLDYLGIELNPKYIEMAKNQIGQAETGVSVKEQKAGQGALWK
jgi:DNA modification methylase